MDLSVRQFLLLAAGGSDWSAGRRRYLRPGDESGGDAGGWAEFVAVLGMGAGRYEKGFAMPYLFAKFPEDLEATEHVVTVLAGAVLRAEPGGKAVGTLDYDILQVKEFPAAAQWLAVERFDGLKGFVAVGDVRSLGAQRVFFEKRGGAWKISAWGGGA